MNFRKGDKVKFLNDVGQGTVVGFRDKNIVLVLNDDGFEIPVPGNQLLKAEGEYTFNDDNISAKPTEKRKEEPFVIPVQQEEDDLEEDGVNTSKEAHVFFALVPKNQKDIINSDIDVYLINDSNFRMLYSVSFTENEFQSLFGYGILEDNTKVYLNTLKKDELNKYKEFNFQIIFFQKGNYFLLHPINKNWLTRPSRFFKLNTFTVNDFFHEKAYIFEVTADEINMAELISDKDIEKAKKEKEKTDHNKQSKSNKPDKTPEIEEVDLHIEQLVDDYKNLSNSEIIDIQLSRFTTALEGGILSGSRRMVFIHGVGNGKLKYEIGKTLDRKYPKLKYQDASFKEYGYGATMVILK
ncbi:MAG TPA: DUF2027 domain-containing protein [Bacteroidales bacterium]|nr:DUF2027 domain-containing protein [Bacteroidales bacterium]